MVTLLPEIDFFFKLLYMKRDIKHSPLLQTASPPLPYFLFFINLIQSAPLADRVSGGQMDELL